MYFKIDDITYAYKVTGNGPPVVLLHGFTGSHLTWDDFVESYQHQYTCITIDLPGHGKTSDYPGRSMESCCHDLAKIFNQLELPSVHLVGYSMGGRVALSFAMLYPSLVKSLTLESSSPGLKTKSERLARKKSDEKLAQKIETEGIEAFVQYWENIPIFQTQNYLPNSIKNKIRKERQSQSPEGLANSLRFMGTGVQPSWWDKLENLKTPVLLIVGSIDEKFVKINEQMKKQLPNAHLEIIHQAGHAVHIEKPSVFNNIVHKFLKNKNSGGF